MLACKNCNSTKSNQTPADRYIDELINRNKTLLAEIIDGKIAEAGQVAVRDLREFVIKDIDEHIRTLVPIAGLMGLERGSTATLRPMSPHMATKGSSFPSSVSAALLAVRHTTRIYNPRVTSFDTAVLLFDDTALLRESLASK